MCFSSYGQKWLLANKISVFLNRQYYINRLIFDFDFWNVDRHELEELGLSAGLLKNFGLGKLTHFRSKNDAFY